MSGTQHAISRIAERQVPRIERVVRRLGHPQQGGFIAILNAIEWQAEIGLADPECVHHLGMALIAFTRSLDIDPDSAGVMREVLPLLQPPLPQDTGGGR